MRSKSAHRALLFLRSEAEQGDRLGVLHSFGMSTTGKARGFLTSGYSYKMAVVFSYKVAVVIPTKWPWITFRNHRVFNTSLQSGRGLFEELPHRRRAVVEGQSLGWFLAPDIASALRINARGPRVFVVHMGGSVDR